MSNDKPYIKLTKTEQLILNSYKKMIVSLGEYLGEGYEIILHSPLLKTSMGIIPAEKTAHRLLIWHFPCSVN